MKDVVLYGASYISQVFCCEAKKSRIINPVAFTVDREYIKQTEIMGLPVIPFEDVLNLYPTTDYQMAVLCGFGHMRNRKKMYEKAKLKGYSLINYISPDAYCEDDIAFNGDNNIIMSGAHIGFGGKIGYDNIIRQGSYIGHNFEIGNHNIIGVNCTFGGFTKIGDLSYFGLSVVAKDRSRFGDEVLIGMGSVVTKPIESYATAYGNPAKIVSFHKDMGVEVLS